MTKTRYQEWVSVSACVAEAGVLLIDTVNGLGLLDEQLIPREAECVKRFLGWGPVIDTPVDLELRTLSHLWVLGGYEVVRILANWTTNDPKIRLAPSRKGLLELK